MTTAPATRDQVAQYGTESVPGTAVPADRLFRSVKVTAKPAIDIGTHQPAGAIFPTTKYVMKEASELKFEGLLCFNELPGQLAWTCGTADTVDNLDDTYTHTFQIGEGVPRTVQFGDSNSASQISGCFVKNFGFTLGRESGDSLIEAEVMGGYWEDGVTLTAAPEAYDTLQIPAATFDVYMDATEAALGTTKLTGVIKCAFKSGDMRDAAWTINSAYQSYSGMKNLPIKDAEIELLTWADSTGRAMLATLRAGDTKYVRIEATQGDNKATFDFAVQVAEHTRDDESDIWAATNKLAVVQDRDGFSHRFAVTNEQISAL